MNVDKSSIPSVRWALDETTRNFDSDMMERITKPLQESDKQNQKLKTARYWLLLLRCLERQAKKSGVEFSVDSDSDENTLFHHPA